MRVQRDIEIQIAIASAVETLAALPVAEAFAHPQHLWESVF